MDSDVVVLRLSCFTFGKHINNAGYLGSIAKMSWETMIFKCAFQSKGGGGY